MGLWQTLIEGFRDGVRAAETAWQDGAPHQRGRIEALCRQCGWSVDGRDGNAIFLHFDDRGASSGIRKVRVADGDKPLVTFSASSHAVLSPRDVPDEALAYLLFRNLNSGIGMWGMAEDGERVTFHVVYQALGEGMDADFFRHACQSLATEAADFDQKLRQAHLLR